MAAIGRLTILIYVAVLGCPLLEERCNPQNNADSEWLKIFHIPNRWIFFEVVRENTFEKIEELLIMQMSSFL